jgi:hypothetical protein
VRRIISGVLVVLIAGGFTWFERWAAPDARLLDQHWQKRAADASATVDHAPWAAFLARYLVVDDAGVHRLRYGAVTAEDRRALADYVDALAATTVTDLGADAQLAFWLNLYNALTVAAVLEAYPVESIRSIDGVWTADRVTVEGRPLSLDDIEHGIVRPVFGDARIHYAVNCAAVGCPNLAAEPYRREDLEAQLDAAARAYVNDPRGVAVDLGGAVTVSSIYNWFREDFGGSEAAVLDHLRRYAEPELAARLGAADGIAGYAYDWALNDAR